MKYEIGDTVRFGQDVTFNVGRTDLTFTVPEGKFARVVKVKKGGGLRVRLLDSDVPSALRTVELRRSELDLVERFLS